MFARVCPRQNYTSSVFKFLNYTPHKWITLTDCNQINFPILIYEANSMHYVIGNISIFFGSFTSSAALSAGVPACQTQKAYASYSMLLYAACCTLSSRFSPPAYMSFREAFSAVLSSVRIFRIRCSRCKPFSWSTPHRSCNNAEHTSVHPESEAPSYPGDQTAWPFPGSSCRTAEPGVFVPVCP